MEEFFGIPRRNFTFYPHSNLKPNRYRNSYPHANPNANQYLNPYHNPNSRSNQYRKPSHNPNRNPQETSNPTLKPRVVSVPIQVVNSDSRASQLPTQTPSPVVPPRPSPEMAAVKLQKVIRGFLVRKNWGIVRKIEAEAEAIGEEIARDEMILKKEVKARIRVGEMLMRLLFRLDSVRGVRDYRKKVIRKVIYLQELVDSIGARGDDKVESNTIEVDRSDVVVDSVEFTAQNPNSPQTEEDKVVEAVDSMEKTPIGVIDKIDSSKCTEEGPSSALEAVDSMKESPIEPIKSIETPQMKILDEKSNVDQELTEAQDRTETPQMEILDEKLNVDQEFTEAQDRTETPQMEKLDEKLNVDEEFTEAEDRTETPQMKILDEKPNVDEESIEAQELDEVCDPTESLEMEESVKRSNAVDQAPESSQVVTCNNENNEMDMKGIKDVIERVVVESERMRNLMEELCQSSARQWQLMEGLVDRVQRLEREVAKSEKRDKKKRKGNGRKCDKL